MIPTNSFSPNGSSHLDSRLWLFAGLILVVGILTFRGDQIVFAGHAPTNCVDPYLTYLPRFGFLITRDRLWADGISAILYTIVLVVISLTTFTFILEKFIEPFMIRRMIAAKRRERANLIRFGDDTF